jgi:NADH dehydrogenase (ubiquinone) 1 alpha subcomplex subunit 5
LCSTNPVHPDPLPALKHTYKSTLTALEAIPSASSYRQATEAITLSRLKVVESAGDNIQQVEQTIGGGQIEEILETAQDELNLVAKMKLVEPYVELILRKRKAH